MSEVKKVLFIVNKFAGTGYQPEVEGRIIKTCERHDVEGIIQFTEGPHHATELAMKAPSLGVQRVVAVGGDGTLNEVASGLLHTPLPMGIIARGSGNGLARHLRIPLTVQGALDSLFTGRILAMDTFLVNKKLSLNVSGIGFDGHVANLFGGKTKRGLAGYIKLVLQEFFQFREFEARITIGSSSLNRKSFVIAFANSSQYGNNACIAPAASVCDGLLHVNILKKIPLYRFDFVFAAFSKTIHRSRFAEILEAHELDIHTSYPVPYHVDGEPCGTGTDFHIVVAPASLQLVVPATTLVC